MFEAWWMRSVVASLLVVGCHELEVTSPATPISSKSPGPAAEQPAEVTSIAEAPPDPATFGPRDAAVVEVEGLHPAVMLVPRVSGDQEARLRVTFIAHGAGGRGVDHCLFWNEELPNDMILICPAGTPLDRRTPDGGSYFPDHLKLRSELQALVGELKARWGTQLSERWRFMGYSQGATMGALAVVDEIPVFDELVLIEGGGENWTARRAQAFQASGGRRVLFACGTRGCAKHAERSTKILNGAHVQAQFENAPGAGHTYAQGVRDAVVRGLARWRELTASSERRP